jgi:ATP-dependent Lhr-like helicase
VALLDHLERRGASFWPELVGAVGQAQLPYDDETVLAALWDLVWAGAVTNDSFAPLRAMVGSRSRSNRRAPRPRAVRRTGPPPAAGRWSLVAPLLEPVPSPTELAAARASLLLDRYGVLTREMALAEGVTAGFAGVYPVLKSMEEQGKVRRGYFVSGLGAAQFARSGAVDRLRTVREPDEDPEVLVLASTDPAQPYGASLAWPTSDGRPSRSAGSRVVLVDGRAVAHLERGGRSIMLFSCEQDDLDAVATALGIAARRQRIEVSNVDGGPVAEHALHDVLTAKGWRLSYRGLRPPG